MSETVGDLLREGLAVLGYACLMFYYDYKLALVVVTGAPLVVYPLVRLGQRVRRTTAAQPGGARPTCRTSPPKRSPATASSRPSAPRSTRATRFKRASERLYRTNLKVTSTVSVLPPLMEFLGGVAIVGLHLVRQQEDQQRRG